MKKNIFFEINDKYVIIIHYYVCIISKILKNGNFLQQFISTLSTGKMSRFRPDKSKKAILRKVSTKKHNDS